MENINKEDTKLAEFLNSIKKVSNSRTHKVRKSYGVYDAYKYIRKNKWFNIERPLTEHEFYNIIRKVNMYLADSIIQGNDITLPDRMGRLEIRKYKSTIKVIDGKIKTNLPVDWDRTLKLWYEDEEAYKNKTLIKVEENEIFKIHYNKYLANYNNKSFYEFNINREIKRKLKQNIKNGNIDAFLI